MYVTVSIVPIGPDFGLIVAERSIEEAALRDLDAVDDGVDVVDAAEVLRRLEGDDELAGRVGRGLREDDGELVGLPAEIVDAVGPRVDDPGHLRRSPGDRDGLVRRQTGPGDRELRPRDCDVGRRLQGAHGRGRLRRRCDRAGKLRDAGEGRARRAVSVRQRREPAGARALLPATRRTQPFSCGGSWLRFPSLSVTE